MRCALRTALLLGLAATAAQAEAPPMTSPEPDARPAGAAAAAPGEPAAGTAAPSAAPAPAIDSAAGPAAGTGPSAAPNDAPGTAAAPAGAYAGPAPGGTPPAPLSGSVASDRGTATTPGTATAEGGYAGPGSRAPGRAPDRAPGRPPVTAPGFAWSEGPTTVAEAVRLFERTCLVTLPTFTGAGALLDGLGFVQYPQMLMRNHAAKRVSALTMNRPDLDAGGVRSCAIIAEGLDQAAVASAVGPLVEARLGIGATRHVSSELDIAHVVWTKPEPGRYTKVIVTESDSAAFMGVTVMPFDGSTRP